MSANEVPAARPIPLSGLTPAKLWALLDPPTRSLAARALYRHEWDDTTTRREADLSVAQAMRFREAMIRKLPINKRADYLAKAVRPLDGLAGSLLLALHLEHRRPMLARFLDALSIPHDNGLIEKGHELSTPSTGTLEAAATTLFAQFPQEEVEVYLATLHVLDPDIWEGLAGIMARRPGREV